jgi:hypothetical protein
VLRSRSYFELVRLQLEAEGETPVRWPYRVVGEHLGLGLAYDLPEAMKMVGQDQLDEWGVGFDEALAVALGNLAGAGRDELASPAPGLWVSPWRDNYDASRLALPDLVRRYEVKGDWVAMVPGRDVLLLTGSDDATGLSRMADLAEATLDGPRPLSALAVRLTGGAWRPFLPEPGHPLHERFKLLWVKSLGQDYGDQKEVLDRRAAKRGEDVFVANYSAFQHKETGRVRSYCVWSEGVESLLPRTDQVMFFRPRGEQDAEIVGEARWDRVEQVAAGLMRPEGLYPERYRVSGFPTEAQLAELGLEE